MLVSWGLGSSGASPPRPPSERAQFTVAAMCALRAWQRSLLAIPLSKMACISSTIWARSAFARAAWRAVIFSDSVALSRTTIPLLDVGRKVPTADPGRDPPKALCGRMELPSRDPGLEPPSGDNNASPTTAPSSIVRHGSKARTAARCFSLADIPSRNPGTPSRSVLFGSPSSAMTVSTSRVPSRTSSVRLPQDSRCRSSLYEVTTDRPLPPISSASTEGNICANRATKDDAASAPLPLPALVEPSKDEIDFFATADLVVRPLGPLSTLDLVLIAEGGLSVVGATSSSP